MRTYTDCIPCFLSQAAAACALLGLSEKKTKAVLDAVALRIPGFPLSSSPPEMGGIIHAIVRKESASSDPYAELKRQSNEAALAILPDLQRSVRKARDCLLRAVELAIAGNIIDYGAVRNLDMKKEIAHIVKNEERAVDREDSRIFAYKAFRRAIGKTTRLLYLADNAGEIVFDRVLIEQIRAVNPRAGIYLAVRGSPVLNDCVRADALACGLDAYATIVSNGSDYPGTLLKDCSPEFRRLWKRCDLVISKGQGNFESLSDAAGAVFFLFTAKCPVVAKEIGARLRDVVLLDGNRH